MHKVWEISEDCHIYLSNPKFRTSKFYMLPKIHKSLDNPPGCPIITERISAFVDYILQPHIRTLKSYVKDTTHFLQILNSLGLIPQNSYLVTLDVSSLYTNTPNAGDLSAAEESLNLLRPGI